MIRHENREPKELPCQRILEEQGFVIIKHIGTAVHKAGDTIPWIDPGPNYKGVMGPLVVIGHATLKEFDAQRRRYTPDATCTPSASDEYLKVVAE